MVSRPYALKHPVAHLDNPRFSKARQWDQLDALKELNAIHREGREGEQVP